ncbi:hypothetical protein [Ensifer sp. M14]|uniref:hypothetical protein n=1 Tax=Ensifer sp. M14 TaxID=2203782 RepID=UPI00131431BF|nr:hypothetical protein [Ensifer sp. M14]
MLLISATLQSAQAGSGRRSKGDAQSAQGRLRLRASRMLTATCCGWPVRPSRAMGLRAMPDPTPVWRIRFNIVLLDCYKSATLHPSDRDGRTKVEIARSPRIDRF